MDTKISALLKIVLIISFILRLKVETRKLQLKEDARPPPRDYRPSKWVANSALDVWYGNKSMIDVLSREFADMMNKIALRPVRSTQNNTQMTFDLTEKYLKNPTNTTLERLNKTISIE